MIQSDVKCPYCGADQEINHDDGYGYEEGEEHEQECVCGEVFIFTTSISYTYAEYCREGDHEMEPFGEKWPGMYGCTRCEYYEKKGDGK